jgi:hypothetical protein
MIVIFQSQAAGDVMMFGDVARRLMEVMDKETGPRGIVTVEQLPDAIARLTALIATDKAALAGLQEEDLPQFEDAETGAKRPYVALGKRAVPLLELLQLALKKDKPVVWGV